MAISPITTRPLGITLQIFFETSFTDLVNNDTKDWASLEAIANEEGAAAREVRYAVVPSRPVANAQMVNPGQIDQPLISGRASQMQEKTASAKQLEVVAEFDYDVYVRCEKSPDLFYESPMQLAMEQEAVTSKEKILKQYYGDGTGVMATSAGIPSVSGGLMTVTATDVSTSRGSILWIQEEMEVVFYSQAGSAHNATVASGSISFYKVESVDYTAKTFMVSARDSSNTQLTITAANAITTNDVVYSTDIANNSGIPDLTSNSTIGDFGGLLYMPGLQALGASDGRTVNGTVLSGQFAGTSSDQGGNALYFTQIGQLVKKIERRVGAGKYDFPMLKLSYDAWLYLTNLDEGNKLLQPVTIQGKDGRGIKTYQYFHEDQTIDVVSRRFVPNYQAWMEPRLVNPMQTGATKKGPLQFKFTGWDYVREPDSDAIFRFKLIGGQRTKTIQAHLQTFGTFICSQSAALGSLTNFTIA